MREVSSGNYSEESVNSEGVNTAQSARLVLSEQSEIGKPLASNSTKVEPLAGANDVVKSGADLPGEQDDEKYFSLDWLKFGKTENQQDVLNKHGLKARTVGGEQEFYYTADKSDHVVLREPAAASVERLSADLDKAAKAQITAIESTYKVKFATPGENVEKQWTQDPTTCKRERGEMIHAIQPSFPGMFGIETGLKRSSPSQFAADGVTGTKIYILDKGYMPNIYGNKQVLGVYKEQDKDKKPALYLTPAGMALPPTEKDADNVPEQRNLAWATTHELTHNSQHNNWSEFAPKELVDKLGWNTIDLNTKEGKTVFKWYQLKGTNGELFMHGADNCQSPSTWYLANSDGDRLDAKGNKVEKIADAAHFTNDEVIARAVVKPITYYFMNPTEMMSEGLTSYRSGPDARTKLAKESPELYKTVQEYDQAEIAKFYGKDAHGQPTYVRTPDGAVVVSDQRALDAIATFEKPLIRKDGATTK